jgi:hypothetical protein
MLAPSSLPHGAQQHRTAVPVTRELGMMWVKRRVVRWELGQR